ncbi:sugar ABC transporter permease [Streptomyces sp. AM8-1-1]|uniref:sugar ABC transporter permease n=1 Tax=Streptomyces sp. AM8-1-1 TaxID=3075825 RepID=UPI0028C4E484|nr:sugar ABC transporter permease [Streptomyces sp. AM8-1-1]WNO76211.1 sugar ABC transporter permease [Streptomyces sp. AM8-1-1]
MTSTDWAGDALKAVIGRVTVTEFEVGTRFPLFADPDSGRWATTGRGSWTGGFWAGLLWLRARYTGAAADRAAASRCTARLAPWADADTATRGLILWYGTALASHDAQATALRERSARTCLEAMDPELGLVPWGSALGGPRLLARADGVPGMVPLLAGAGPEGAAAAGAHLHRHLELCLGDGSEHRPWTQPAWCYDAGSGWQPCEDPPRGWSRGRAWLLLAVADALHLPTLPGPRAAPLSGAAERLLALGAVLDGPLVPHALDEPLVPHADPSRPDGPLDTSAAAITAVALLKLARLPGPRATQYADRAVEILRRLVGTHLSGPRAHRPAGMLLDGCYDAGRGTAVRHELVWGDFFLALGLAALTGSVDITDV